jgi:hypothetical protein
MSRTCFIVPKPASNFTIVKKLIQSLPLLSGYLPCRDCWNRKQAIKLPPTNALVLDAGTGTAQIPVLFCQMRPASQVKVRISGLTHDDLRNRVSATIFQRNFGVCVSPESINLQRGMGRRNALGIGYEEKPSTPDLLRYIKTNYQNIMFIEFILNLN